MNKKKPNLFIVGAPKCGTTSLHAYLSQHSNVFMSELKEPCYFASDFQAPYYPKTLFEYLELFKNAENEKYRGEATTTYLYSKFAAKEIKEFCPEAKIIIMLRNPVDMMYSLFLQRLWEGSENIDDFEKALEAEDFRKKGKLIQKNLMFPVEYLYYREMAKFSNQIKRYMDNFPRENVHFIIFDHLKNNLENVFNGVCDFLEISKYEDIEFKIQNPSKRWRNLYIRSFVTSRPVSNMLKIVPSKVKKFFKLLAVEQSRPEISEELRKKLISEYKSDIKNLEKLTGIDLYHWYSIANN